MMKSFATHSSRAALTAFALAALVACSVPPTGPDKRDGPHAVHPGDFARASAAPAPAAPAADAGTEARGIFDTYCVPFDTNTARARAVEASGQFVEKGFGQLPVPEFSDLVFAFYQLRGSDAQIGFASRRGEEEFCVTVDGTATGNELNVLRPRG